MAPPRATYRLQLHRGFTFRDALALVPYLADLGVSHLYISPLCEARPGSTHGYDIVNHNRLNPEIGREEEFQALSAALRERGMGIIVDIVPNHMGVGADNAWWMDVLEWGEDSPYADYFDINWRDGRPDLEGRVLLPVLGGPYGATLTAGDIELRFDAGDGSFSFWYWEHRFPVSPRSYHRILAAGGAALGALAAKFVLRSAQREAREHFETAKRHLAETAGDLEITAAIERAVASWQGIPGRVASFRPLHRLLEAQAYRLAYWRVAADEINYRRFFNINDLVGLRVELPKLFAETHKMIFAMAERGDIDGLRIDHIDGLFDPARYLEALRDGASRPLYLIVEKILARYETLRDWPIDGSTGYDFVNQVLGLFVDTAAEGAMTGLYRRMTGEAADFDTVLQACKWRIVQVNLASEMNVLARRLHRLSMADWRTRDFTFNSMLSAVEQVVGAFPVYRTYVSERGTGADDRRYVDWAVGQARKQAGTADTSIFDFLHQVLTGELPARARRSDALRVAMQFQQVTGPVMAKASEDTAFYRYARLLALNEVGGDPRRFGLSLAGFHHLMRERQQSWPHAMSATATHDTKRGEDARIKIAMLSELPRLWAQSVTRWFRSNRSRRAEIDGSPVPDRNTEYLFYQMLVGVWPPGVGPTDTAGVAELAERVRGAMIKSVREQKLHSSWSNPNDAYETALERFVMMVLDASRPNAFLADFRSFIELIERPAAIASLAQLAIKLTAPGVPDIYQGCDLWDFSLVDPDNRRPPDWSQRRALLSEIAEATPEALQAEWRDGREKLFLTRKLLQLRREYPALFAEGDYQPLYGEGGRGDEHLCAFARRHGETTLVLAAPRLVYRLHQGGDRPNWGATLLPLPHQGDWRNIIDGCVYADSDRVPAAELFREFPVAALLHHD
ncbi:MAG TPA: malto-oligosyltrehalose synthase [Stellaceae bacterium]|jgi:(1->4)-alpha-D-glucan 1-alpha-D-glucosylmutase|nr:malto-oligosyltrehalose synthase [Stellaceae bacterium]